MLLFCQRGVADAAYTVVMSVRASDVAWIEWGGLTEGTVPPAWLQVLLLPVETLGYSRSNLFN